MFKFILELYASHSANTLLLMLPVATCQACDREFFDRWRGLMAMNYALHTHTHTYYPEKAENCALFQKGITHIDHLSVRVTFARDDRMNALSAVPTCSLAPQSRTVNPLAIVFGVESIVRTGV